MKIFKSSFLAVLLSVLTALPSFSAAEVIYSPIIHGKTIINGNLTVNGSTSVTGSQTFTDPSVYGVTAAVSAGATQTQAGATLLTKEINVVSTVTTAGDGVRLPTAAVGLQIVVINSGANIVAIYPFASDSIDSLSANLPVRLQPGGVALFRAKTTVIWESSIDKSLTLNAPTTASGQLELKAADSAGNTITTITNASQAAARTYTIPDAGASANFIMSEGAATINGAKTFGSGIVTPSVTVATPLVTTPVGTVSVAEYGNGKDMTTVLTLTNFIVGALAGAGAALGVGNIVAAFPAGQHFELVYSFSSLALTAAGTAVATDTGLGSVIASGAVATLDGTATFEDRLTGQTISTASGGGAAVSTIKAATAGIGTGIALNTSGAVKNVYLNSAGTWNANNTGNLTASGTIVLKWTKMN